MSDSSEDELGPAIPEGVLRRRAGWSDRENFEIEHQRERLRSDAEASSAAVDLSQFRNEEVGKGYQAKHVVRQAVAASSNDAVIDMTGNQKEAKKSKKRNKRVNEQVADAEGSRKHSRPDPRLGTYLGNKHMRDFVREVDKIINQRR
mmetsp:Transcript_17655/g.41195  ORF Transcript_17655/g.41195 Transcript_17655/m.41195 type:complete len:147 (-) Transcript_17655:1544-1984(-)